MAQRSPRARKGDKRPTNPARPKITGGGTAIGAPGVAMRAPAPTRNAAPDETDPLASVIVPKSLLVETSPDASLQLPPLPPLDGAAASAGNPSRTEPAAVEDAIRGAPKAAVRGRVIRSHARQTPWPATAEPGVTVLHLPAMTLAAEAEVAGTSGPVPEGAPTPLDAPPGKGTTAPAEEHGEPQAPTVEPFGATTIVTESASVAVIAGSNGGGKATPGNDVPQPRSPMPGSRPAAKTAAKSKRRPRGERPQLVLLALAAAGVVIAMAGIVGRDNTTRQRADRYSVVAPPAPKPSDDGRVTAGMTAPTPAPVAREPIPNRSTLVLPASSVGVRDTPATVTAAPLPVAEAPAQTRPEVARIVWAARPEDGTADLEAAPVAKAAPAPAADVEQAAAPRTVTDIIAPETIRTAARERPRVIARRPVVTVGQDAGAGAQASRWDAVPPLVDGVPASDARPRTSADAAWDAVPPLAARRVDAPENP